MRKAANLAILAAVVLGALPYALGERWWVVVACALIGVLWLAPTGPGANLFPTLSTFFLTGVCAAGVFLDHPSSWLLTTLVMILAAWDLDSYARDHQPFLEEPNKAAGSALFRAHLERLGIIVLVGWSLGMVALYLRIPLSFVGAAVLGALALLGLRLGIRLVQGR